MSDRPASPMYRQADRMHARDILGDDFKLPMAIMRIDVAYDFRRGGPVPVTIRGVLTDDSPGRYLVNYEPTIIVTDPGNGKQYRLVEVSDP